MINALLNRIDSHEFSRLPIYRSIRVASPDSQIPSDSDPFLRLLARIQAAFSLFSILVIAGLIYTGHFIDSRLDLPRLLALVVISLFIDRAFALVHQRHSPKHWRRQTTLHYVCLCLQCCWITSELAFTSAFAPVVNFLIPTAALPVAQSSLALDILPTATMVTFTACIDFFARFRRRRRNSVTHRRLASASDDDLASLNITTTNSSMVMLPSDALSTPPLSPADSYASGSSGALASDVSSPTGHCPSPDRRALQMARREISGTLISSDSSCDIYLKQHILDTNESVLFVHKKLKPIKTRITPEPEPLKRDYKPILSQLIAHSVHKQQQQQQPGVTQPGSPLFQPSVVATISVVHPKGTTRPVGNLATHNSNSIVGTLPMVR